MVIQPVCGDLGGWFIIVLTCFNHSIPDSLSYPRLLMIRNNQNTSTLGACPRPAGLQAI